MTGKGRSLPLGHAPANSRNLAPGVIGQAAKQVWAVHPSETARANTKNRIRSGRAPGPSVRSWPLVDPARRGLVRELLHSGQDPAPGRRAVVIAGERQLVTRRKPNTSGALTKNIGSPDSLPA